MRNINLITQRQEELRKKSKKVFYFQMFSFSLLIIYGLFVVGVFAYYFILLQQSKVLGRQISAQEERIEEYVDVETKQFYLKRKTANLEKIMEYSAEYQDIIEGFLALLPEGVEVKNFSISEDKEIGFGGNTNSFGAMTQLFDNIEQGRLGESIIYAAEVKKVGYNEGIYSFSFQLNLNPVDLTDKEK